MWTYLIYVSCHVCLLGNMTGNVKYVNIITY